MAGLAAVYATCSVRNLLMFRDLRTDGCRACEREMAAFLGSDGPCRKRYEAARPIRTICGGAPMPLWRMHAVRTRLPAGQRPRHAEHRPAGPVPMHRAGRYFRQHPYVPAKSPTAINRIDPRARRALAPPRDTTPRSRPEGTVLPMMQRPLPGAALSARPWRVPYPATLIRISLCRTSSRAAD